MTNPEQNQEQEVVNPYKVETDYGFEVYQNQSGLISIKQEGNMSDESIVVVSAERADKLIEFIKAVQKEILDDRPF